MRYVSSLPPLPAVNEENAPRPIRSVRPARPVEPRTRVLQEIQRVGPNTRNEGVVSRPPAVWLEKRTANDRREWCRRLQHGQPFLNTRSAVERRKNRRRDNDIVTTLDEEG